jgi:hypothetical protein
LEVAQIEVVVDRLSQLEDGLFDLRGDFLLWWLCRLSSLEPLHPLLEEALFEADGMSVTDAHERGCLGEGKMSVLDFLEQMVSFHFYLREVVLFHGISSPGRYFRGLRRCDISNWE